MRLYNYLLVATRISMYSRVALLALLSIFFSASAYAGHVNPVRSEVSGAALSKLQATSTAVHIQSESVGFKNLPLPIWFKVHVLGGTATAAFTKEIFYSSAPKATRFFHGKIMFSGRNGKMMGAAPIAGMVNKKTMFLSFSKLTNPKRPATFYQLTFPLTGEPKVAARTRLRSARGSEKRSCPLNEPKNNGHIRSPHSPIVPMHATEKKGTVAHIESYVVQRLGLDVDVDTAWINRFGGDRNMARNVAYGVVNGINAIIGPRFAKFYDITSYQYRGNQAGWEFINSDDISYVLTSYKNQKFALDGNLGAPSNGQVYFVFSGKEYFNYYNGQQRPTSGLAYIEGMCSAWSTKYGLNGAFGVVSAGFDMPLAASHESYHLFGMDHDLDNPYSTLYPYLDSRQLYDKGWVNTAQVNQYMGYMSTLTRQHTYNWPLVPSCLGPVQLRN